MSRPVDPYTDPETGVLRNLVGARTQAELSRAEGDLSFVRLAEVADRYPVQRTGDLDEMKGIHRYLFQDVYEWAGQTRTVELRKGWEPFVVSSVIGSSADRTFEGLRQEAGLQGLSRDEFVGRLAYYYSSLNYLHPFREGNGRTQRVFWSRVAADAGWSLDWRQATREQNNEASRTAMEDFDLQPLRTMFDGMVTAQPAHTGPGSQPALETARLAFGVSATEAVRPRAEPPGASPGRSGPGRVEDRGPEIGG